MDDKNGKLLKIGDCVIVEFVVEEISDKEDFVRLRSVEPLYPQTNRFDRQWMKAKLTILQEEVK